MVYLVLIIHHTWDVLTLVLLSELVPVGIGVLQPCEMSCHLLLYCISVYNCIIYTLVVVEQVPLKYMIIEDCLVDVLIYCVYVI